MQDGCKNLRKFLHGWASNGSFKNGLLEVGLPQNRKIMAHRTFTTIGLFYFIMCEDPHEERSIEITTD